MGSVEWGEGRERGERRKDRVREREMTYVFQFFFFLIKKLINSFKNW